MACTIKILLKHKRSVIDNSKVMLPIVMSQSSLTIITYDHHLCSKHRPLYLSETQRQCAFSEVDTFQQIYDNVKGSLAYYLVKNNDWERCFATAIPNSCPAPGKNWWKPHQGLLNSLHSEIPCPNSSILWCSPVANVLEELKVFRWWLH